MLVSVQRVTNFLILSQIVCLVLLWNLFLVMYGVMQEILLEEKNIMLVLFMTLASSTTRENPSNSAGIMPISSTGYDASGKALQLKVSSSVY